MPKGTEEVVTTNTEVIENNDEEEIVDNKETEQEEDDEEEDEIDPRDLKIKELEEKNKSLYEKLKSGYKKHSEKKTSQSLNPEEVKKVLLELQKEEQDEKRLTESFEDAKDLLPEIKKLQQEKGLDIDTAYDVVKGRVMRDEGYRNQIYGERAKNYGNFEKKEPGFKYSHLFTTPKVAQPRNKS